MNLHQFANGTYEQRNEVFEKTADKFDMSASVIEKDFWVCWSLKQLFTLPAFGNHMIFKGGTSLSKAYDVIHRFSEDIDLTLDRKLFGFEGNHDPGYPGLSGKKQQKLLKELQGTIETVVSGPLLTEIQDVFSSNLQHDFVLEVDPDDPQTILFKYETPGKNSDEYINPVIRLEFGARGVQLPARQMQISSYIEQVFPDFMGKNETNVKVLGIERTFWEKATILHKLYHKSPEKPLVRRMSRHYYDMAQLIKSNAKKSAIDNIDLLKEVAHDTSIFFRTGWAEYDQAKPGTLKLMPNDNVARELREDYTRMKVMIFKDVLDFDDILEVIGNFEMEINAPEHDKMQYPEL